MKRVLNLLALGNYININEVKVMIARFTMNPGLQTLNVIGYLINKKLTWTLGSLAQKYISNFTNTYLGSPRLVNGLVYCSEMTS
jgi:hypothetical protein